MGAVTALFTDHASALGGAEHSLLMLLRHLDGERWRPHLACAEGPLAEHARGLDVCVHNVPMPRLRRSTRFVSDWVKGVWCLVRLAQHIEAAFLYANTVRAAIYTSCAARLVRRPFIWHMRDFWLSEEQPGHPAIDRLGKRLLCASATKVVANSRATAAHIPCSRHLTVIHNGIELGPFDPTLDGSSFRREYGIPLEARVVGMVGRLRPWKGQDRFLRAASQVLPQLPDAHFLVVGGDPFNVNNLYENKLYTLVQDLTLDRRVTFTGHLEDVRPALGAMDLFVHPGDPEPFGLVNVEAMAMARPVVAFAHGALPEIVLDQRTGLLVPPGDEEALARAIVTLLCDDEQRQRLGLAGRARVAKHFTIQQTMEQVDVLFQQVLQVSGAEQNL